MARRTRSAGHRIRSGSAAVVLACAVAVGLLGSGTWLDRACAQGIADGSIAKDEREVAACAVPGAPAFAIDERVPPPSREELGADGKPKPSAGIKIIGPPVRAGWFNDTVAIDMGEGKLCTGVVVGPEAVLTAGHCVCDGKLDDPGAHAAGSTPSVVFGSTSQPNDRDPTQNYKYRFTLDLKLTALLDPTFCRGYRTIGGTYMHGNDLALLFLDTKAQTTSTTADYRDLLPLVPPDGDGSLVNQTFKMMSGRAFLGSTRSSFVYPATPATPQLYFSSSVRRMIAVGFGLGRDPGTSDRLRPGEKRLSCIDVRSRICGFPEDRQQYGCAAGREIVLADPVGDRDSCSGDSGGPVYTVVRRGNIYYYYLTGITSRGVAGNRCGPGGIYTLITPRVVAWMRSKGVAVPNYESPDQ